MGEMGDMSAAAPPAVEELELALLLEALFQHDGFDFRGHERGTLKRRLLGVMRQRGLRTISAMQESVLHDHRAASALLRALQVAPATLFDDAQEAAQLRQLLGPCLHATVLPRIWLADCAGAEQAWTLAILLHEAGLLAHTEIHATVASDELLEQAQTATLAPQRIGPCQDGYARSGGSARVADYFVSEGGGLVPLPQLRSRITWAQYNLVTDASFNEFQMIVCRRALPDFGPLLRQRVLRLFHASLAPLGVLGLDRGMDDDIGLGVSYRTIIDGQHWFKKVA